jgi:hypothetical protein
VHDSVSEPKKKTCLKEVTVGRNLSFAGRIIISSTTTSWFRAGRNRSFPEAAALHDQGQFHSGVHRPDTQCALSHSHGRFAVPRPAEAYAALRQYGKLRVDGHEVCNLHPSELADLPLKHPCIPG